MSRPRVDFLLESDRWPGLAKVMEEAAEVLQVCAKIIGAHGEDVYFDGTNLRTHLEEELGDLSAIINFLIAHAGLSMTDIERRSMQKRFKFEQWRDDNR